MNRQRESFETTLIYINDLVEKSKAIDVGDTATHLTLLTALNRLTYELANDISSRVKNSIQFIPDVEYFNYIRSNLDTWEFYTLDWYPKPESVEESKELLPLAIKDVTSSILRYLMTHTEEVTKVRSGDDYDYNLITNVMAFIMPKLDKYEEYHANTEEALKALRVKLRMLLYPNS